jgi:hypothetical protein
MALWELQCLDQLDEEIGHENPDCDFCEAKKLDNWYRNDDDDETMCVPCIWKRNETEGK